MLRFDSAAVIAVALRIKPAGSRYLAVDGGFRLRCSTC